ncbi:MAG: hypothetical protein AB1671_01055 [Thermodesulfobacteriota bacterium]|jgi:hypothetical protein
MKGDRIRLLVAHGLLGLGLILSPLACTRQEGTQEEGTTTTQEQQQREGEKPPEGTQTP